MGIVDNKFCDAGKGIVDRGVVIEVFVKTGKGIFNIRGAGRFSITGVCSFKVEIVTGRPENWGAKNLKSGGGGIIGIVGCDTTGSFNWIVGDDIGKIILGLEVEGGIDINKLSLGLDAAPKFSFFLSSKVIPAPPKGILDLSPKIPFDFKAFIKSLRFTKSSRTFASSANFLSSGIDKSSIPNDIFIKLWEYSVE